MCAWTAHYDAVRRRIAVTHSIGLIGFADAEREVAQAAREGIRTFKIKVGVDPDRDVEMVRRVRDTVGPKVALCIDANQGYATPAEAIRTFRRMEQAEILYFEQPVEGIARLAEVARAIDAPVMADESAWNAHDVIEIAEKRAAQIVSIYTTKPGGLFRAMEVAAVARAAGIVCNVNGSVETGIGNRANIVLASVAPAVTLSCVVPVSTPAEAQSRPGRRNLLQRRSDRRADALCRRRDRGSRRARNGHRGRRGEACALFGGDVGSTGSGGDVLGTIFGEEFGHRQSITKESPPRGRARRCTSLGYHPGLISFHGIKTWGSWETAASLSAAYGGSSKQPGFLLDCASGVSVAWLLLQALRILVRRENC